MKNMLNEGNQINNFISSSGSGINYCSGSDFLTSYGSGSTSQKVTVPTNPVPVPQRCLQIVFYGLGDDVGSGPAPGCHLLKRLVNDPWQNRKWRLFLAKM
jgi:hypothetical protein